MANKEAFETLESQVGKYKIDVNSYQIDQSNIRETESPLYEEQINSVASFSKPSKALLAPDGKATNQRNRFDDILLFKEPEVDLQWPRISLWDYMDKEQLIALLKLDRKRDVKKQIEETINDVLPKGVPRVVFRELMYSVTKFCKQTKFSVEQSGHVLSNFYFTHMFFTGALERTPEKIYLYFKDFLLCHCLPYPPDSVKLFTHQEARQIMEYFCKIYLRNLPLIRFLCLPNFAAYLDYTIKPDIVPGKKKGKKDKKGKKGKKGKGKKGKGKKGKGNKGKGKKGKGKKKK